MAMSFVKVYFDFEERTEMLNEVEQGRLLLAMLRYAEGKELPELKGGERFLFPVFKIDIDRDTATYNAKVGNGAKGGRPKQETEDNLTKPNETKDNLNAKNKNKKEEQEQEQEQEQERGDKPARAESVPDDGFDDFWAVYPRKVSKKNAVKAWKAAKVSPELDGQIVKDVKRRCETEWKGADMQFIPHPATYLNQRRWEDETPPTERSEKQQGRPEGWHNPALDYAQRDYTGTKPKPPVKVMNIETGEWEVLP